MTGGPAIVVGGGISGIACARRLHRAAVPVTVLERGRRLGGRMAVRTERLPTGPHPVDVGAPYFTVRGDAFTAVVTGWQDRGLARPWTDTLLLTGPDGPTGTSTGTQRWSSPGGMRGLVEDLATGLDVRLETEVTTVDVGPDGAPRVDGVSAPAVVLAMPDPQAAWLLPSTQAARLGVADSEWNAALCVWAGWRERWWAPMDGAFVDGTDVAWVADDGRSRGDGAPVLVAHTTADLAGRHLDDHDRAVGTVLAELPRILAAATMPDPQWARVHRWTLASPRGPHRASYALDGRIGVCGDGWGPRSRVEQAWQSGDRLGEELARRLGAPLG